MKVGGIGAHTGKPINAANFATGRLPEDAASPLTDR
jgi:hypothetical protein